MTMLIVQDIQGHQEPLMVQNLHITKQLNTLTQIDFNTVNTPDNESAFEMIQPRSIFIDPIDNEIYRISQKTGQELGDLYQLQITALQVLTDLSDTYIKDVMYNTQSLDSVMSFITKNLVQKVLTVVRLLAMHLPMICLSIRLLRIITLSGRAMAIILIYTIRLVVKISLYVSTKMTFTPYKKQLILPRLKHKFTERVKRTITEIQP